MTPGQSLPSGETVLQGGRRPRLHARTPSLGPGQTNSIAGKTSARPGTEPRRGMDRRPLILVLLLAVPLACM